MARMKEIAMMMTEQADEPEPGPEDENRGTRAEKCCWPAQ